MKTYLTPILLAFLFFTACSSEIDNSLDAEIEEIEMGLFTATQINGESPTKYSIAERMNHYKVPGLSIAVIKDGKIHWAKGYGIANTLENRKVEVSPNTLFQAGSISKPIAALSVLKMAQEGKLDLDEDVNTYLQNWEMEN